MDTYCVGRSSHPARLFSLVLLDVPQGVRLRRPRLREATAAFGLSRLATASLNIPGLTLHRLHRGGDDDLLQYGGWAGGDKSAFWRVKRPLSFAVRRFLTLAFQWNTMSPCLRSLC